MDGGTDQPTDQLSARNQRYLKKVSIFSDYFDYKTALSLAKLQTLKARRSILSQRFAIKCVKNEKTKNMFPLNPNTVNTRHSEKYMVTKARTSRLANSAIPSMQRLLNKVKLNRK